MSSHDGTASADNKEQPPAHAMTSRRDERAGAVLGRLEAQMVKSRLRGHIYLTERTVVEFATRQKRAEAAGWRPLVGEPGPYWADSRRRWSKAGCAATST